MIDIAGVAVDADGATVGSKLVFDPLQADSALIIKNIAPVAKNFLSILLLNE